MLLKIPDELGGGSDASDRQGTALDEKVLAAGSGELAVKNGEEISGKRRLI